MALTDTIEIKFSAKGDDVLIQTIKSLDRATKSLVKAQRALAGEGKKQVQSKDKHKKQVEALIIKVKALGGNWSKNTKLLDLHRKALKGDKVAMEQLRIATTKYTAQLKQGNKGILDTAHSTRILGGSFAVLRSKLLIASFAIMLVERTVVSLVKSFAKQEAVNQKLRAGLANIADTTEGVTQRLIDYSSALQKTTAFGDELITNGMVQLTTFGLNEEAIKSLTPQVLNVARAIQTTSGQMPDLNSLFIAFGKSTSTAVSALTRYGVVLTDAEKAQLESMAANERATAIAKILDKQYGGLAEAYAKTTMGMLEGAEAARGDAAEAFGRVLAPAVLAVSKALKAMAEAVTPEHIKAYGTGFSVAATGAGLLAVKIKDVRKAMQSLQALAVKNWVAALVAVLGVGVGVALDYFDVFEDGNDTLTDAEKRLRDAKVALENLTQSQAEGLEDLKLRLALLNARTEKEKLILQLGHDASKEEKILIDLIVKRMAQIAKEAESQKQADKEKKERIEALNEQQRRFAKEERERNSAIREVFKDNMEFQLLLIENQANAFRDMNIDSANDGIAITEWEEQKKTDIIIAHLEKRNVLYNAFSAGYDQFVNTLTDSELSGKERRERIWEAIQSSFVRFLGEMLKEQIKQMIVDKVISKTAQLESIASAKVTGLAIANAYATPAFLSSTSTFGGAAVTGLSSITAGLAATKVLANFAEHGFEGFVDKPTLFMTGEGNKREHVSITPLESPNLNGSQGFEGGGITVNISAPLVDETVVESIIPAIEKAQRLNLA